MNYLRFIARRLAKSLGGIHLHLEYKKFQIVDSLIRPDSLILSLSAFTFVENQKKIACIRSNLTDIQQYNS